MPTKMNEPGFMTHMPFLARGANGETVLFFCRAAALSAEGTYTWKASYLDAGGMARRLETGLPDEVTECSPTAWQDESGWHLSFIAGGRRDNPRFDLYRMDGSALDRLSPPVALRRTRTGFVHRERMVWGELRDLVHVEGPAHDQVIELPGAYILRVAYRADAPDTLLITGQWIDAPAAGAPARADDDLFTLEYELATGRQHFIECDGRPAYKCTILGDEVLYAERFGLHFEERRLRRAANVKRRPSRVATRRLVDPALKGALPAMGGCGCKGSPSRNVTPTRPSCLECVEKHLGAAYVLLAETRDGYAHRLRAIGHLHEAEDESQEWRALHDAIRIARKGYQREAAMPDWEALEGLVGKVRAHAQ